MPSSTVRIMTLKQWRLTHEVATSEGGKRTMTISDAARRLGVHRATYFNWETGKRFPGLVSWGHIWSAMALNGAPDVATARRMASIKRAQRRVYDKARATSRKKSRE